MQYHITSHLSLEQPNLLIEIKGTILDTILFDEAGEFALSAVINTSNKKLLIRNIPMVQVDGDEYPKLVIESAKGEIQNYKEKFIGKLIKSISILRDEAVWHNSDESWVVCSDIGIKLVLEDREILLIALDSLAGFIKIVELKEATYHKNILEEYWGMKADVLDSLKREEISI